MAVPTTTPPRQLTLGHNCFQVDAVKEAVGKMTDGFALAKTSPRGLDYAPLSEFESFYADTPTEEVRHLLRHLAVTNSR